MQYICRCINTGEVRGWMDYGNRLAPPRVELYLITGVIKWYLVPSHVCTFWASCSESLALVSATLTAREQRRKLSSWLHVPQVPVLCCRIMYSRPLAFRPREVSGCYDWWIVQGCGSKWPRAASVYYSGMERWRKRLALLLLSRENIGPLARDAGKHCHVDLCVGHFRFRPPFSVDCNPTFEIAYQTNSLDRVLRKLVSARLSQKFPVFYVCRKFSTQYLTGPYSQLQ